MKLQQFGVFGDLCLYFRTYSIESSKKGNTITLDLGVLLVLGKQGKGIIRIL